MAIFETVKCDNWHDLHLQIDDYFTHYDGYIFRGQADAEWQLESSLTRAIRSSYPNATPESMQPLARQHLQSFKRNIRGRCSLDLNTTPDHTLWALGQHFGLYTLLLDWSRSPYVALFFSLFGSCVSGRRSLWALFESDVEEFWSGEDTSKGLCVIHPLGHDNLRLVNQNGLFLEVPVGLAAEDLIQSAKDMEWISMYKFEFPDSIRTDALSALNNMNINHASLFPDLIGSSLFSNFQLEVQPHLEEGRTNGFTGED
ncbi:MAG: FRG domain-containing protein [Methylobacter sp.]